MQKGSLAALLKRVARRQRVASVVERLWRFWLFAAGAYLLLLLLSRMLGLIPPWFTAGSIAGVPLLALLLALAFHRRASPLEAARLVDARTSSKDLFLTASTLERSLGDYQGLVLEEAERRAATVKPAQILRWEWRRGAAWGAGSLAVLCLGVLLLPQLDPFGRQQERKRVSAQQALLKEGIKATALRAVMLAAAVEVRTNPIAQAVAELQKTFNMAKPEEKPATFARLNEEQKILGELWRKASEEKLRDTLNRALGLQNFGMNDPAKAQQWKSDLDKGDLRSVKKELNELKEQARQLGKTTDPVRQEELRQELANRLQALQEALAQQMNSGQLDSALQRALEQLGMSNQKGLTSEALKGLAASLDLSAEELKRLAQDLQDLKNLEDAMKALQSAKRLHGLKALDGKLCRDCKTPGEYAALFEALYAAAGGRGAARAGVPGMGMGEGQGIGPRPHGDDSAATDFTPRQAPSTFQPGQVLLSWKQREVSDPGHAREEFRQAVQAVRQEASEAVLEEQIPSSYHTAIKTYFDTLNDEAAKPDHP